MVTERRAGLAPFFLATNALIWISSVIVLGIVSYWLSLNNNQGSHIIYEEVIVSTVSSHCIDAF